MSKLYLLSGMPFSGKSTLGKTITQYLDCPFVSLDEINESRGLCGGDGISIEEWEKTHSIAMEQLRVLMPLSQNIVLDDTNCFRWIRDRFRNLGAKYNYQTIVIFLDTPFAEIMRRIKHNQKTQARHKVKLEIVNEMVKTFELPEADEICIRYSAGQSIDKWIISYFQNI